MIIGRNNHDLSSLFNDVHQKDYKILLDSNGIVKSITSRNFPKLKMFYSTVHRSKGLEAENVILINLKNQLVGFPNKISDDPLLSFVLTDADQYRYAEERRLFYVALTRTKNNVYLIAPDRKTSAFVEELIKKHKILFNLVTNEDSMRENPNCPHCRSGKLVIRENNANGKHFLCCSNYPRCSSTLKDISILKNPSVVLLAVVIWLKEKDPMVSFTGVQIIQFVKTHMILKRKRKTSS